MFKKLVVAFSLFSILLSGGQVVFAQSVAMQLDVQKYKEGSKKSGSFFKSVGKACKSFVNIVIKFVNAFANAVVKFFEGFFRFVKDPLGTAKKRPNKTLRPGERLRDKGLIN